jgi:hypothetical protein
MIDPALMTNEELDQLAKDMPFFKAWAAAVEAAIKTQLEAGETFRHATLKPTQARRNWIADLDVLAMLRKFSRLDVVAPRKVLSPAEAEKTLGKKVYADKIAKFVTKTSSGMALVFSTEELEN